MPKLQQVATATTTTEVKLTPALRRKLVRELRSYQEVQQQLQTLLKTKEIQDLQKTLAAHLRAAGEIRHSTGAKILEIEGFKITKVTGTMTVWDEKRLLTMIDVDQLAEVKVKKDKKPYEKISCPGEEGEDE